MIKTLIVDDEPHARSMLHRLLAAEPDIEVVGEALDGKDALEKLKRLAPELLFLDVQMPGLTGIQLVENLQDERIPYVIFTTAYGQYAPQAFDLDAVDYILKPYDDVRIRRAVQRAKRRLGNQALTMDDKNLSRLREGVERLSRLLDNEHHLEVLTVHVGGKLRFLDPKRVRYIKADGNYVRVVGDGEPVLARERIAGMEEQLRGARFLRIHRSVLVNLAFLRELRPHGNGDYEFLLESGESFVSGSAYRLQVRAAMDIESRGKQR